MLTLGWLESQLIACGPNPDVYRISSLEIVQRYLTFWACLGQNSTNTPDSATLEHSCVGDDGRQCQVYLSKLKQSCRNLGEKRECIWGGQSALPPSGQWESQTQTNTSRSQAELHPAHGLQNSTMATIRVAKGRAVVPQTEPRGLHRSSMSHVHVTRTGRPQQQYYGITLRKPDQTATLITALRQFLCSFKVTDALLQWTIKLLPQNNSVSYLTPKQ